MESKNKQIALLGCGALGSVIAKQIAAGHAGNYDLAGILSHTGAAADEWNSTVYTDEEAMLEDNIDFIVEAAGAEPLKRILLPALERGISVIPLSTGVFADETLYQQAQNICQESGAKVYLPAGAVGGFDLMGAMAWAPEVQVRIQTEKPHKGLAGAPALNGRVLSDEIPETVFTGTASEAIRQFPKNVNVAVSVGLATVGPDRLNVTVASNPELSSNRHTVLVESSLGKAEIQIAAAPSHNARSSSLAAYSVLHILKKLDSPICFL